MKVKKLKSDGQRSFAVVLETGEEAVENLLAFARAHDVTAASFTALGAFRDVKLGFFDIDKKDYQPIEIDDQVEVLTLVGNFAIQDGEARLHPHVIVSGRDGHAFGGHLLEGHVRPTLEVVVTDEPAHLRRRTDAETGLPLLVP